MNEIIVTGGRSYQDRDKVFDVLSKLRPDLVIQGGATGADALAKEWCHIAGVKCHTEEALWTRHGNSAGPIRNGNMLSLFPNAMVVAFPGNNGTADCVRKAQVLKRIVLRVL